MNAFIVFWHPDPRSFNGDIAAIMRLIQRGILQFVGFSVLEPHIVFGPASPSEDQRQGKVA